MSEGFALAFAEPEARYKAAVMQQTWGHLAPGPGDHPLWVMVTEGDFGDITIIKVEYPTLPCSPWLASALFEFVNKHAFKHMDRGMVHEWKGVLRWYKNGGSRFVHGRWRNVKVRVPQLLRKNP